MIIEPQENGDVEVIARDMYIAMRYIHPDMPVLQKLQLICLMLRPLLIKYEADGDWLSIRLDGTERFQWGEILKQT